MPVYEFNVRNLNTGEVLASVTIPVPMKDRDAVIIERIAIPSNVRMCSVEGTDRDPTIQKNAVLHGAKIMESRMGTREFERRLGFPSKHLKQTWETP